MLFSCYVREWLVVDDMMVWFVLVDDLGYEWLLVVLLLIRVSMLVLFYFRGERVVLFGAGCYVWWMFSGLDWCFLVLVVYLFIFVVELRVI